jgi:hypothetical protein
MSLTDLVSILKSKCEAARERADAAEAEFRTWKAALDLALNSSQTNGNVTGSNSHSPARRLVPDFHLAARMKNEIFRKVVQRAGRPLKPAEIIKMVQPQLSRSYVYFLISELKASGDLIEDEHGRVALSEKQESGTQGSAVEAKRTKSVT